MYKTGEQYIKEYMTSLVDLVTEGKAAGFNYFEASYRHGVKQIAVDVKNEDFAKIMQELGGVFQRNEGDMQYYTHRGYTWCTVGDNRETAEVTEDMIIKLENLVDKLYDSLNAFEGYKAQVAISNCCIFLDFFVNDQSELTKVFQSKLEEKKFEEEPYYKLVYHENGLYNSIGIFKDI